MPVGIIITIYEESLNDETIERLFSFPLTEMIGTSTNTLRVHTIRKFTLFSDIVFEFFESLITEL